MNTEVGLTGYGLAGAVKSDSNHWIIALSSCGELEVDEVVEVEVLVEVDDSFEGERELELEFKLA